jgi:hypothetical protein
VLSTGLAAIDRLLPGGGLARGLLVEWVGSVNDEARMTNDEGKQFSHSSFVIRHSSFSSATTLSLLAAREACREGGLLVVVDRQRTFYPPAASAWGVDLDRLIVVRPTSARDQLWAAVESLRSPAVVAVWTAIEQIDDRAFRRLQLAAHAGRTLGVLVRPASTAREPSWADVRLGVGKEEGETRRGGEWEKRKTERRDHWFFSPSPHLPLSHSDFARCAKVCVLRCRHGRAGGAVSIEIDDVAHTVREASVHYDAHPLPVVAELADPASPTCSERRA